MTGPIVKLGLVVKVRTILEIVMDLLSEDVKIVHNHKICSNQAKQKNM